MSKIRSNYLVISTFGEVEVGTVLVGNVEASDTNEKNAYVWRKEDDIKARLVVNDKGEWAEVTKEIMDGDDIVSPRSGLSVAKLKENRQNNWKNVLGRRPNLEVEFGKNEVVCVIDLPKARS